MARVVGIGLQDFSIFSFFYYYTEMFLRSQEGRRISGTSQVTRQHPYAIFSSDSK